MKLGYKRNLNKKIFCMNSFVKRKEVNNFNFHRNILMEKCTRFANKFFVEYKLYVQRNSFVIAVLRFQLDKQAQQ